MSFNVAPATLLGLPLDLHRGSAFPVEGGNHLKGDSLVSALQPSWPIRSRMAPGAAGHAAVLAAHLPHEVNAAGREQTVALMDAIRSARRLSRFQKKREPGTYSAHRAALGGRTLKHGQSRCFVGYKKHTLRLWWRADTDGVLLIPSVSWVAPANVSEGGLLVPSLHDCARRWF